DDREAPRAGEPADERERRQLVGGVQVRGRLVEEQDVSLLCERHGEDGLLTLAARDLRDRPVRERQERELVERAIDCRAVDGGGATEQRQPGGTAQGDDLPHGEREEGLEYLRDDRDPSCDLAPRERPEVAAVEADITGPRDEESRQRAQQRRLPGSVRADQAHDLARADADVAVVEHFAVAVSGDDRACRERGHTSIRRRWRSRRPRKNGPPTSPVTTPTGSSAGERTVRGPVAAMTIAAATASSVPSSIATPPSSHPRTARRRRTMRSLATRSSVTIAAANDERMTPARSTVRTLVRPPSDESRQTIAADASAP